MVYIVICCVSYCYRFKELAAELSSILRILLLWSRMLKEILTLLTDSLDAPNQQSERIDDIVSCNIVIFR